jgi:putative spermidine/putrescine transport system permease protein
MTDVTDATTGKRAPTPDDALRMADSKASGPMLAADGTPLKKSLRRAQRAQKIRALMLIAPLLIFVLLTFIAPIVDMLFRSAENQIVRETLPRTVVALQEWDAESGELPPEDVYEAFYYDLFNAAEARRHTRLGQRLNYENTGMSSLFRGTGRAVDDFREADFETLEDLDPKWEDAGFWFEMMSGEGGEALLEARRTDFLALAGDAKRGPLGDAWCIARGIFAAPCPVSPEDIPLNFTLSGEIAELLPKTATAYADFAVFTVLEEEDVVAEEEPWEAVYTALGQDLRALSPEALAAYDGPGAAELAAAKTALDATAPTPFREAFIAADSDWGEVDAWRTIQTYSPAYTTGYFLNAVDMQKTPDGPALRDEDERIYGLLFQRTMFMSLMITVSCILLGYPIAWILANLPMRTANLLMILVLLPFWTSLLVRTSAWKVMLQQQVVVNDTLVWLGIVADDSRLALINNQTGTIIAMTHILLPFMILPLYSVMKTIPPSYLRAAKSLGATNWTAFWRVYFPQSVPGIGAGSILVFILAIGYYITPEIVGGTTGTFISNRIAFHISSSLNWGLAAALGAILLAVVLALYWAYDKVVGIDNVKLGG